MSLYPLFQSVSDVMALVFARRDDCMVSSRFEFEKVVLKTQQIRCLFSALLWFVLITDKRPVYVVITTRLCSFDTDFLQAMSCYAKFA